MSGATDKGVLESLAGWCNEKNIGKPEYDRRSAAYDTVAELIEAAAKASVALNNYRATGKPDYAALTEAADALQPALAFARVQP